MLVIHNSETKRKEIFTPITPGKVNMYVCGMTVYDYCHIGHARVLVSFDVITRYLRYSGYEVNYVRNITDIDDKIIRRANENGENFHALTARFIAAMDEDAAALGVIRPNSEPKATDYIGEIVGMVSSLVDKGSAYPANNGDVYYDVSTFASYGRLSHRNLDELQAGARVEVDEVKTDPLDFVLWKAAKPGEPSWASPWGLGRPGWHIECSAMSTCCLGNHFDIHGGGGDLAFPHHENEIAQSEAATGEKYVNTWMHVGFVQVKTKKDDGSGEETEEKMSKSLGNFFTIRDVLTRYQPEVLRYFITCSQYRSPLTYSFEALDNARAALGSFYTTLSSLSLGNVGEPAAAGQYEVRFRAAMDDDFNTPEALAVLFEIAREANRLAKAEKVVEAGEYGKLLKRLGGILGILQDDPAAFRQGGAGDADANAAITAAIAAIAEARKQKDFATSDRLREELKAQGVVVEFGRDGIKWRRAD